MFKVSQQLSYYTFPFYHEGLNERNPSFDLLVPCGAADSGMLVFLV